MAGLTLDLQEHCSAGCRALNLEQSLVALVVAGWMGCWGQGHQWSWVEDADWLVPVEAGDRYGGQWGMSWDWGVEEPTGVDLECWGWVVGHLDDLGNHLQAVGVQGLGTDQGWHCWMEDRRG